ncbi:MAG: response regulator transcription factor [Pontiellaceae bacterium]|nr:response regulator transcription factor [Pontiellaceae bacterium]MBN2784649.1 response regulator transcription factor [Pontiellaceae bacterium]
MKKILIAEDDANIRAGLIDLFESDGFDVCAVGDGATALGQYAAGRFDLVLLDVMMPEKSGYDVCREIRKSDSRVPIIMLTAKGEEIDKVVGLQLGADDYVTKPFGVHELLARVEAVLRRAGETNPTSSIPDTFSFGAATVDCRAYTISMAGNSEPLSHRELELIRFFHEHAGEVLSRNQLLDAVWGVGYFGTTRTLDQHVSKLRKKMEADPANPSALRTVHGVGYRYCP